MEIDNQPGWEMQDAIEAERVRQLHAAFEECRQKGVSSKSLMTLAFETGATWESDHQQKKAA